MNRTLLEPQYKRLSWDIDPKLNRHYEAIRYGKAPGGYAEDDTARPLIPGRCYLVETEAEGRGHTGFRVMDDGTLHELSPDEVRDLYGAFRIGITRADGSVQPYSAHERDSAERAWRAPQVADSTAKALCYAGYQRARTRADTNNVDRQVHYDTTADGLLTFDESPGRALTCQFVCTKIGPSANASEHDRRSWCEPPKRISMWRRPNER